MSERIPQSTAYLWVFRAFLASDGKTPATGKTIAVTLSKNGATSFSNPNAGATNATEMASGFYKASLDTTDIGTLGPLSLKASQADINDVGEVLMVVKATNAGFSSTPDAAANAANGLPVSIAGGLDLDSKLANTNEVTAQRMGALTDWINGGRLDLLIDAILEDTAVIGANGAGLSAIPDLAGVATLLARLTALRAGYLDNLNVGGPVASSAEVVGIQNNTRAVRVVPDVFERPDSGSTVFRIELLLYDSVGNMEVPDSAPTLGVVNQGGTSRDSNLDSTTMALVSTGRYRATYTVDTNHAIEQLIFAFSVVEGGNTRILANPAQVVDTTAVDFTAADRLKLEQLATDYTTLRATKLDNLDATVSSRTKPADTQAAVTLVTTTTNLTNAPTSGDLTATMKTSAQTAAAAALTVYDPPTKSELDTAESNIRGADSDTLKTVSDQLDATASQSSVNDLPTNSELATALTAAFTSQITESYAALGAAPTRDQVLMAVNQILTKFVITDNGNGTSTLTIKKLNNTDAMTMLLNGDATTPPTSSARAT